LKLLYPNIVDIGCFSHTIDHVGEKFETPVLEVMALTTMNSHNHTTTTVTMCAEAHSSFCMGWGRGSDEFVSCSSVPLHIIPRTRLFWKIKEEFQQQSMVE
jgi:hypothetical protein